MRMLWPLLLMLVGCAHGGVGLNAEAQEAPWLSRLFWALLPF